MHSRVIDELKVLKFLLEVKKEGPKSRVHAQKTSSQWKTKQAPRWRTEAPWLLRSQCLHQMQMI